MNMLNAWTNNTLIGLKLTFRDRQAIFWTYGFPLFFLFLFAGIFARGRAEAERSHSRRVCGTAASA